MNARNMAIITVTTSDLFPLVRASSGASMTKFLYVWGWQSDGEVVDYISFQYIYIYIHISPNVVIDIFD